MHPFSENQIGVEMMAQMLLIEFNNQSLKDWNKKL